MLASLITLSFTLSPTPVKDRKERGDFYDSWRQRKQNQTANDLTIESMNLVDLLSANGNPCLSSHRGWD